MTWLSIRAGLILAAAIIPPLVLLYFLKLRRRAQPIASTLLWKRSVEDMRANTPFQRLRRNILLVLQLAAVILLALAIMQPQVQAGERSAGKTIFLIDNSASMTATDVGDTGLTRLDEAKRLARSRIETLYGRGLFNQAAGQTMVIAFSDRAEIYCPFTDSRPLLLAAIDRIAPTHGESRIAEALTLARAYTTNVDPDSDRPIGEPAALELYSDGRIADLADQVLRRETLIYYPIGSETADNVGVTAISIERTYDRPTAVEVFAAFSNFNREPVTCDVQLSVNGAARAIEEITIEAASEDLATGLLLPQRKNVIFTPFEQPLGAVIEVANLRADDLAADNGARLVVPPPKQLKVALVESRSFLLRTLLEGMASIERLALLDAKAFEELAATGGIDPWDVVILDNYAPPVLPPGRYLSFGATPPVEGLTEFGGGEGQIILDTAGDHPVFRFVNVERLFISKFRLIQPGADVQVLAEGSAGPAVLSVSRGPMRVVHVTFDPLDSNWPFLRGFVTFVVNAVEHLGRAGEAISASSFAPGDALVTRLPAAAAAVELNKPDGTVEPLQVTDPELFTWGPIRLSGVYGLSWQEPGAAERAARVFAVNCTSELEGDIVPAPQILAREEGVTVAGGRGARYTPLWPWAIGLCLAVVMLEWWVYHRKL